MDVAYRRSRNIPTKFFSGLSKCIELYVGPPDAWKETKEAGNRLFTPEKGGSYIFEQRPLDPRILAYCAQDVALMFQLEAAMKSKIEGKGWGKRILVGSANRLGVAESKSSIYSGQGRHRAIAPIF